ncbi:MAG: DNA polymerase III subunit alpha [Gemmataceae bacterium]|nr:DNA polymerase III subunit alpha [Gemmataceae bacterium]
MSASPFVHLHCHTHYSLLDGASRVPELVQRVKSLGMNSVAMTDHGNLYGAIEFYQECKDGGLNPVIGYEAYVAPKGRVDREAKKRGDAGFHLTLLAQSKKGFQNLIQLASKAFLEGFYYVPRIDKEILREYSEGIICLSGCASSEFSDFILQEKLEEAKELARWFAKIFKSRFFVEIQNNGIPIQAECARGAIDIANQLGLPLVATSDAHYLEPQDSPAHDVLLCINTGKIRTDPNRIKYGSDQFYIRAPAEMYTLFPLQQEAVKRSQEIADSVDIQLDFSKRHFPVFLPPEGKKPEKYLREICQEGFKKRYGKSPPAQAVERLNQELDIICRMGFASYFLIVGDFVRFAKEKGIPCCARGSACGALVSFVLELSHVDPLEYGLLFERFLDPNRSEAPDIDIDFCKDRREEVIAYVREKYGEDSVAQIATFGTMAARAAIKDVGRVLNIPLDRIIKVGEMVPETPGITLDEAIKANSELKKTIQEDQEIAELIAIAKKLEGTNRNAGTHAAGLVISDGPLTDFVPLQRIVRKGEEGQRKEEGVVTTQWVMGDLEKVGLLKMDFLGLRTLTALENAVQMIDKNHGKKINLDELLLDDKATYELLQRGDAKGVFQLDSSGIRDLLKRMRPDNIRDIIAIMALYRPGPLEGGMVDAYINRKHGREKPTYAHPVMETILRETHGVMVYQEQIMQILNQLGGIELSSAYACIKAISKKKQEVIDQRREEFIKGAGKRGVDGKTAADIFQLIVVFGGYGFNKSHSAAYALIGYHTAYLKTHFRAEFMAALLTSEIDDSNKRDILVQHIEDSRKGGVEVLPPSVNTSDGKFTVRQGKILFGLRAIKGCGNSAAQELVKARQEGGPYRDIFDLCERLDSRIVGKPVLEKLIKAGALDFFQAHRAQLMHLLPRAMQAAIDRQRDKRFGQSSLFGMGSASTTTESEISQQGSQVPVWPEADKLKFEKEVLDFYFSSHPLAQFEKEIRRYSSHGTNQLRELPPDNEVTLGGMMSQIRIMNVKKPRNGNSRYVRFRMEDFHGSVNCVMWPEDFLRYKDDIQEDRVCFVRGKVERNREEPGLILQRVISVEQAAMDMAKGLHLQLALGKNTATDLHRIANLLKSAPGACQVFLSIKDYEKNLCVMKLGKEYSISPMRFPAEELEEILGEENVKLS